MTGLALTWWGHASTTVEIGGARVATDPLLGDRLLHLRRYAASPAARAFEADVVLISHLHHDHLHLPSLRRFGRETPILVPRGGESLLRSVGGRVWVLGTVRRGSKCPKCGEWVAGHRGTQQTEGMSDLVAFVPDRREGRLPLSLVFIEMKADGGRMSPEQRKFRELAIRACVDHVVGGFNAVLGLCVERGLVKPENVPHYRASALRLQTQGES